MSAKDREKNDVIRSTVKKTADLGTKFALSFVPGATTIYDLTKLGVEQLKAYAQQKQEKRILQFHEMLIAPSEDWDQDLADACIEGIDYHLLLSACVQDIEDEKTALYAEVAKNAAAKKISSESLRFFALSLKEFSYKDMEEMRHAYVATHFSLMAMSGSGNYTQDLSPESARDFRVYGRRMMDARGFLKDGALSNLGEDFLRYCYSSAELTPAAIGMHEWRNRHAPLLTFCDELEDIDTFNFINSLTEQLRNERLRIGAISSLTHSVLPSAPTISLLVIKSAAERILKNQKLLQQILRKKCIAIFLTEDFPSELEDIRSQLKMIIQLPNGTAVDAVKKISKQIVNSGIFDASTGNERI